MSHKSLAAVRSREVMERLESFSPCSLHTRGGWGVGEEGGFVVSALIGL